MSYSKSGITVGGLISIVALLFIGGVIVSIIFTNVTVGGSEQRIATANAELNKFASEMRYQVNAKSIKPDSNGDGNVSVTIRYQVIGKNGELGQEQTDNIICNYRPQIMNGGGCRVRTPYDSISDY